MRKGRPGGNPDLEKYQFQKKHDWEEPCTTQLVIKVPASMKDELKKIDGWPEIVRKAITERLNEIQGAAELEKTHKKN